ncbi:hypothetical protein COOONC_04519 [Cooperia oncophora]
MNYITWLMFALPLIYAEKSVLCCFCVLLALWIFRDPGFFTGFGGWFPKNCYTDATSAMIVAVLLFALPSEKPDIFTYKTKEELKKKSRLMDWPTIQKTFPWNVVMLLGGGFALAQGVQKSGLSDCIGNSLTGLNHLPLWLLQAVTMAIVMTVTNFCSNTVTATIFVNIVAKLVRIHNTLKIIGETVLTYGAGLQWKRILFTLMLPTTMSCSFALVLPVGTPPNAIVFGSGMVKSLTIWVTAGVVISLECLFLTVLYMNSAAYMFVPLAEFPTWASFNSSVPL